MFTKDETHSFNNLISMCVSLAYTISDLGIGPKCQTHSALVNAVGDFVDKLDGHPELSDEAVATDVHIEHVELVVDGLHLAHFTQPHVYILGGVQQQRLELVLRVQQYLPRNTGVGSLVSGGR